ncbi:MAG: hypothetical protein Athens101426_44 [Parcubacteria group bacterium Athens1014_26]|nr:MAG: hypothetical protein Athens101426_44 [Parcubacteria group bacterium Athens1014_26]
MAKQVKLALAPKSKRRISYLANGSDGNISCLTRTSCPGFCACASKSKS